MIKLYAQHASTIATQVKEEPVKRRENFSLLKTQMA